MSQNYSAKEHDGLRKVSLFDTRGLRAAISIYASFAYAHPALYRRSNRTVSLTSVYPPSTASVETDSEPPR